MWRFDYWKFSSLTVRSACGNPGNIPNGRGTFNSTSPSNVQPIWTTVTYSCISGYQLIGVKTRQCRPNGQWSGIGSPVCRGNIPNSHCISLIMSSYDIMTEAKSEKGIFRPLSLVHVHMNRVAREGRSAWKKSCALERFLYDLEKCFR